MSKILIDHTVLEQALEDMEMTINYVQSPTRREGMRDSIEALRAALEQEKSPQNASSALQASCEVPQVTDQTEHFLVLADEECYHLVASSVEQEPVAWCHLHYYKDGSYFADCLQHYQDSYCKTPLYPHPHPPRQPLTDAQINDHRLALAYDSEDLPDPWDFKQGVRAAERAHGITGEQA